MIFWDYKFHYSRAWRWLISLSSFCWLVSRNSPARNASSTTKKIILLIWYSVLKFYLNKLCESWKPNRVRRRCENIRWEPKNFQNFDPKFLTCISKNLARFANSIFFFFQIFWSSSTHWRNQVFAKIWRKPLFRDFVWAFLKQTSTQVKQKTTAKSFLTFSEFD